MIICYHNEKTSKLLINIAKLFFHGFTEWWITCLRICLPLTWELELHHYLQDCYEGCSVFMWTLLSGHSGLFSVCAFYLLKSQIVNGFELHQLK